MKITSLFAAVLPLTAGCLGSAPRAAVNWTIEAEPAKVVAAETAKWGAVRVTQVNVRAPYDGTRFVILRANGSVAYDSYNTFAASPSALLRGVCHDTLAASGLFKQVLPSASAAAAELAIEVSVERLAIDCRERDSRTASVALSVRLVKDRAVIGSAVGEGTCPAAGGAYTAAFSSAFNRALSEALKLLQDDGASAPDRQKRR